MNFATFDFEAYNWTKFKTAGFYDGVNYDYFTDLDDFLRHVLRKKYRNYSIFAHYGGGFDFKFILPKLQDLKYKIDIFEKNSNIMLIKLSDGKNTWKFLDSYFMLPQAQDKLAKAFKVDHQKEKIDFTKLKESDYYKEPMVKRLRNDCIGLYEIITKYKSWGLNKEKLKPTIASQSLYVFRNKYLTDRLYPLDSKSEEFIRKTYYGGRVEIFKMYGKNLNYYDANSLYPTVMLEDMPTGKPCWTTQYKPEKIGFYKIEVNIPKTQITFIPHIFNRKLYFPCGQFTAYVTSVEVDMLKERSIPFKVIKGIYFSGKKPIFRQYIKDLYQIKQNAQPDSMDYLNAKLLMNSLYGKFAQKRDHEKIVIPSNPYQIVEENLKPYYEELNIYKKEEKSKSEFVLPYISSYITSLARAELYKKMEEVGFDRVYYCDTDSLITCKTLRTSNQLGGWKKEYDRILEGVFLQPKSYYLRCEGYDVKRLKGMPNPEFSFEDFKEALFRNDLSKLKQKYYKIAGFKEMLVRYRSLGIKRLAVEKQLKSFYSKRRILKNFNTETFNIKELTVI